MNTINLGQQFDTTDEDFQLKWNTLGQALLSFDAGAVSINITNQEQYLSLNP